MRNDTQGRVALRGDEKHEIYAISESIAHFLVTPGSKVRLVSAGEGQPRMKMGASTHNAKLITWWASHVIDDYM